MYILYVQGEIVDQFNPIPDYWDDSIDEEEIKRWKGNAQVITKYIPGLHENMIERYLKRWDLDEEPQKAYEGDQFTNEDWQFIDFMDKVGLSYPMDDANNATGTVYKLWTNELKLANASLPAKAKIPADAPAKKWWKFW